LPFLTHFILVRLRISTLCNRVCFFGKETNGIDVLDELSLGCGLM